MPAASNSMCPGLGTDSAEDLAPDLAYPIGQEIDRARPLDRDARAQPGRSPRQPSEICTGAGCRRGLIDHPPLRRRPALALQQMVVDVAGLAARCDLGPVAAGANHLEL